MNPITRRIRGNRRGEQDATDLAGLVADPDALPADASITDRLHQLRRLGAEQLRVAAELESAARAQRVAVQELHHGIDALLSDWERQAAPVSTFGGLALVPGPAPVSPSAAHQAAGLRPMPPAHQRAVPEADVHGGGLHAPARAVRLRTRGGRRASIRSPEHSTSRSLSARTPTRPRRPSA